MSNKLDELKEAVEKTRQARLDAGHTLDEAAEAYGEASDAYAEALKLQEEHEIRINQ